VTKLVGFPFNNRRHRHTAATRWLSGGVRIETVSKNLGHLSINTTQIYADLVDEARKREMEAYWARTGTQTGTGGRTKRVPNLLNCLSQDYIRAVSSGGRAPAF